MFFVKYIYILRQVWRSLQKLVIKRLFRDCPQLDLNVDPLPAGFGGGPPKSEVGGSAEGNVGAYVSPIVVTLS